MTELTRVEQDIRKERLRQIMRYGSANGHPDGTGGPAREQMASLAKQARREATEVGDLNWLLILQEEVHEVFACAPNSPEMREELVQVAATVVAWIESYDRRGGKDA